MYNARLVEKRTRTKEPSSGYPSLNDQVALDRNINACMPLLMAAKDMVTLKGGRRTFEAFTGTVTHQEMVDVLRDLKWARPETFAPDLAWIASLPEDVIDRWDIMLPQQKAGKRVNLRGIGKFTVHGRKVERETSIRGNSESAHRDAIDEIPGRTPTSGCVILYPVMNKEELDGEIADNGWPTRVVMALMLQLPAAAVPADRRPLVYQVVVPGKPLYALVEE
jgi:hypothetical protein